VLGKPSLVRGQLSHVLALVQIIKHLYKAIKRLGVPHYVLHVLIGNHDAAYGLGEVDHKTPISYIIPGDVLQGVPVVGGPHELHGWLRQDQVAH
jgi:NhaP-type Na+/H+ and K+/H+ antiporter